MSVIKYVQTLLFVLNDYFSNNFFNWACLILKDQTGF